MGNRLVLAGACLLAVSCHRSALSFSTPAPDAATTPENSCDGMIGVRSGPDPSELYVQVCGHVSSWGVIEAAFTATNTSPGPGSGRGTSSYLNCSGPPLV